ncbi:phosphoglucosamine mutase [Candidatus Saccharibacteria bacterium]|nr:phosphoglucosamine mutase [Candidatus Saccharibacteria bacterium]
MGKYFGTDGIRRKADKFTPDFMEGVAVGLKHYADEIGVESPKVVIGGDTRESTEWILRDFEKALESVGMEYANVGVLPTPGINYAFYDINYDFAIDVTASHNPYTDNGIKVFERGDEYGVKLSRAGVEAIENSLDDINYTEAAGGEEVENIHEEAVSLYLKHLRDYVDKIGPAEMAREGVDFSGMRIGLDCANGATSVTARRIFEELGAEVTVINDNAEYGTGINRGCGSTHLEALQLLVKEGRLDFGAAFDGDGDRCLMIDHTGTVVDGDEMLMIISEWLGLSEIATTVMANQGLFNWAAGKGVDLAITDVGDANVFARMREEGILLGGEQSGHIILPGEPMGDGVLTALVMTKIISMTHQSLHDLASGMEKLPQIIHNFPATAEEKKRLAECDDIIAEYTQKVESAGGRMLVRPSGTEELIRITIWGKDAEEIEKIAKELEEALCQKLKD